jgi:hypothetical protein
MAPRSASEKELLFVRFWVRKITVFMGCLKIMFCLYCRYIFLEKVVSLGKQIYNPISINGEKKWDERFSPGIIKRSNSTLQTKNFRLNFSPKVCLIWFNFAVYSFGLYGMFPAVVDNFVIVKVIEFVKLVNEFLFRNVLFRVSSIKTQLALGWIKCPRAQNPFK